MGDEFRRDVSAPKAGALLIFPQCCYAFSSSERRNFFHRLKSRSCSRSALARSRYRGRSQRLRRRVTFDWWPTPISNSNSAPERDRSAVHRPSELSSVRLNEMWRGRVCGDFTPRLAQLCVYPLVSEQTHLDVRRRFDQRSAAIVGYIKSVDNARQRMIDTDTRRAVHTPAHTLAGQSTHARHTETKVDCSMVNCAVCLPVRVWTCFFFECRLM